jgi:hypothetical protein
MAKKRPAAGTSTKNKRHKQSDSRSAPKAAKTKAKGATVAAVKGKHKAPVYVDVPETRIEEGYDPDEIEKGLEGLATGASFLSTLDAKQISK